MSDAARSKRVSRASSRWSRAGHLLKEIAPRSTTFGSLYIKNLRFLGFYLARDGGGSANDHRSTAGRGAGTNDVGDLHLFSARVKTPTCKRRSDWMWQSRRFRHQIERS